MRALAGSPGVRVPTVYFEDDGAPPEVSPFHAMNIVPGECLEPILSEVHRTTAAVDPGTGLRRRRAMLAALHRVDPDADRPRCREAVHARRRDPALDARLRDRRRADERAVPRSREAALRHDAARVPRRRLPRRLPPREHAVRRHRGRRAHRLGDLVAVRPAPRPRVVPLLHRRGEAPDGEQPRPDRHADGAGVARRLRRGVRRGARQPRVVPLPHPLQGGGRDRTAHEAVREVGRRRRRRVGPDPRA